MEEEIRICPKCFFKCVRSQLMKTKGVCPRLSCGDGNRFVWKDIKNLTAEAVEVTS